jgi:hypothetical protein
MFPGTIIDLSYRRWVIPPQSTVIIVVNFGIEYMVLSSEFDRVDANFASDEFGQSVICPWVELTLPTRPEAAAQLKP